MRKCRNAKLESSCATQPASVGGCLAWINTGNPDHSISTTYFCILPTTYINLKKLPLDVDLVIFGVKGDWTLQVGVDERLVAELPLNLIGVWDRRESATGDEGGVAGGRLCNDGEAKGIEIYYIIVNDL